ncbi:MAG: 50S ribosomal protein L25 [Actinomycetota bacterium]|nr:50S ribosomal protein L25 [Actinomycetota bacterium]
MQQETLRAQTRVASGTRPARRLRRENRVPAVVYGRGLETISISIDSRELYAALHTEAGFNALIDLEVEGREAVLSVAREVQRDPVRREITHLDFIKVSLDVEIEAEVALEYLGTPIGVREEAGFVETIAATVMIQALPTAIPTVIQLNIDDLDIGDTLKASDLPEIEGVTYLVEADQPLVTVLLPAAVIAEEEEEEALEGELEEGEEGEETGDESEEGGEG